MSRFDKRLIYKMLRDVNTIETPTLNTYFKSVWVGEGAKRRIEKAKKRLRSK